MTTLWRHGEEVGQAIRETLRDDDSNRIFLAVIAGESRRR